MVGPCSDHWELRAFSVESADREQDHGDGVGESDDSSEEHYHALAEESRHRKQRTETEVDEERDCSDNDGLPGVEADIGASIVGGDSQEQDRRDHGEVAESAKGVFRDTGVGRFRHDEVFGHVHIS